MDDLRSMAVTQQGFDVAAVLARQTTSLRHAVLTKAARHGPAGLVDDFDQITAMEFAADVKYAARQQGSTPTGQRLHRAERNIAVAFLVDVPVETTRAVRVSITIPADLLEQIDRAANYRSKFLANAARAALRSAA